MSPPPAPDGRTRLSAAGTYLDAGAVVRHAGGQRDEHCNRSPHVRTRQAPPTRRGPSARVHFWHRATTHQHQHARSGGPGCSPGEDGLTRRHLAAGSPWPGAQSTAPRRAPPSRAGPQSPGQPHLPGSENHLRPTNPATCQAFSVALCPQAPCPSPRTALTLPYPVSPTDRCRHRLGSPVLGHQLVPNDALPLHQRCGASGPTRL